MSESLNDILLVATIFAGVLGASFWLAIVIWAYNDMRARSRDPLAQLLVAILVFLLNIPGVFIYILLRPRENLVRSIRAFAGRRGAAARKSRSAQAAPVADNGYSTIGKPAHIAIIV